MDPQYTETVSEDGKTFTVSFLAPKQLLLHPEYSAMVHDEVLRRAHARGLIPIGEIFHSEEEVKRERQRPLKEGESLVTQRLRAMGIGPMSDSTFAALGGLHEPDLMKVTAEVVLGASVDLTLDDPAAPEPPLTQPKAAPSLADLLDAGIPNDLSELDDL